MVALLSRKRRPARWSDRVGRQSSKQLPPALKEKIVGKVEPALFEDTACQFQPSLARYVGSAGWLFISHHASCRTLRPVVDLPGGSTEGKLATITISPRSFPRNFQNLPTEIHFQIASYLPNYTILLLTESDKLGERLRQIYRLVDPSGERLVFSKLSHEERCIWYELHTRDGFEKTPYPLDVANLGDATRKVWNCAKFHCYCCKKVVGLSHFPNSQMLENTKNRTGMSKITERKCFPYVMPVQLWEESVITWGQLQEARNELRRPERQRAVRDLDWYCHPTCHITGELRTYAPRLSQSTVDTLTLHRVFPNKVETRAEYFINLYEPMRFRAANASVIIDVVEVKKPYICPHLNLMDVLHRLMASDPIDFGSLQDAPPNRTQTVAEVMVVAMEKAPWLPTPELRRSNRPLCKVKENSIW